jgi:KDO2-lipid IV(A) lauroyltransferase
MPIDPQQIINSRYSLALASLLGRILSPEPGYRLANFIADQISAQRSWKMVRVVRANQWVVRGETQNKKELDLAVRDTFRYIAHSVFDLYHYINNPEAIEKLIVFNPTVLQVIQRPLYTERGLIVVGLHYSNFDFVLQAGSIKGLKGMVLTIPDLKSGYKEQYEMRKKTGMNIVPASISALRKAVEHLRAGGLVLTGMDRPDGVSSYRPLFFGQPAALPIHPIYLAIKAKVPVLVVAAILQADGTYHFLSSDLIEMQPYPDRYTEQMRNTETILKISEGFISQAPQQWSMTLPVWPEALERVPE